MSLRVWKWTGLACGCSSRTPEAGRPHSRVLRFTLFIHAQHTRVANCCRKVKDCGYAVRAAMILFPFWRRLKAPALQQMHVRCANFEQRAHVRCANIEHASTFNLRFVFNSSPLPWDPCRSQDEMACFLFGSSCLRHHKPKTPS